MSAFLPDSLIFHQDVSSAAPRCVLTITGVNQENLTAAERVRDLARNMGIRAGIVLTVQHEGWKLKDDSATLEFVHDSASRGHELMLGGLGPLGVQPKIGEFHRLGKHEATLRITAATRQLAVLGIKPTIFAPTRWLASEEAIASARQCGFSVAADAYYIHDLVSGSSIPTRVLALGDGFGATRWWRRSLLYTAQRTAAKQQDIRVSISANKAMKDATVEDLMRIMTVLRHAGYHASIYGHVALTPQAHVA